jgi:glucokinase
MQKVVIAVDLGGTKCAGAAITESGEILHKIIEKISGLSGDAVSMAVCSIILKLTDQIEPAGHVVGIGISVPGISYQDTGQVWAPNIPGWDNYPLKDTLKHKLGLATFIHIDNDRACSICGEYWMGIAKGHQNAIFLAVGTGIGAGILVDGQVLRGQNDIAGAVGWLALDHDYPEGYQQFGCFEYNASGDGLVRLGKDISRHSNGPSLLNMETLRAEDIFKLYEEKDPIAVETIHTAIEYWAKAIANLVSIFNPEIIVFGGGVFGPGLKFLDLIYERSKKWAQPIAIEQVKLVGGKLGVNAQLLGAAKLVFDNLN